MGYYINPNLYYIYCILVRGTYEIILYGVYNKILQMCIV